MRRTLASIVSATAMAILIASPVQAQADVFIEYAVTGVVEYSGRDADAVLCSASEDGFLVHSIGKWVIEIETDSPDDGEHEAQFRVAAPGDVTALKDDDFRTDDRPKGDGTVVIENTGTRQMNFPLLKVQFTAKGLESGGGAKIDLEGTLVCALM